MECALFSYFVNRSSDHILPVRLCLPGVMVVALLALSRSLLCAIDRFSPRARWDRRELDGRNRGPPVVAIAWSNAGLRFSQSALAYAPPGGQVAEGRLGSSLAIPRRFCLRRSADATRLLETYMPDEGRSRSCSPHSDLTVEMLLVRTDSDQRDSAQRPREDSLVADLHKSPPSRMPSPTLSRDTGCSSTAGALGRFSGLPRGARAPSPSLVPQAGFAGAERACQRAAVGTPCDRRATDCGSPARPGEGELRVVELLLACTRGSAAVLARRHDAAGGGGAGAPRPKPSSGRRRRRS